MIFSRLILIFWCAIYAGGATAHEFWIDADSYQVAPGERILGNLRNGQYFEGTDLAYMTSRFLRFDVIQGDTVQPVAGRMGDSPALNIPAPADGLVTLVHETTPSFVTYKEWKDFKTFADHKDFPEVAARHVANGFPNPPFKERYTRHVKALIAVGSGAGMDRVMGLRTEFVALSNPYDPAFDGQMQVQVLYQGAPRANAQVEVFERAPEGKVDITLHRTDGDGIAVIPVQPAHTYLFDAVTLKPILNDDNAVWDTFWAALTFAVPAR